MNRDGLNPIARPGSPAPSLRFAGIGALLCVILAGCASTPSRPPGLSRGEGPLNVYAAAPFLSADVKRVVVLPLTGEEGRAELIEGCESLEPVLLAELIKSKRFEAVCISPSELRFYSGRSSWSGNEALPPQFFDALHEAYGCDAVLFCELTRFHAYAPLTVGWRMKLVETRTKQVLWASDEIFDAGRSEPGGLHRYWLWSEAPALSNSQWELQNSPGSFGQYTLACLFATLPAR